LIEPLRNDWAESIERLITAEEAEFVFRVKGAVIID